MAAVSLRCCPLGFGFSADPRAGGKAAVKNAIREGVGEDAFDHFWCAGHDQIGLIMTRKSGVQKAAGREGADGCGIAGVKKGQEMIGLVAVIVFKDEISFVDLIKGSQAARPVGKFYHHRAFEQIAVIAKAQTGEGVEIFKHFWGARRHRRCGSEREGGWAWDRGGSGLEGQLGFLLLRAKGRQRADRRDHWGDLWRKISTLTT